MLKNIEKPLTITLLAIGIKLDEKKKKRKKRFVWMKPWLTNRLGTSAYQNIFQKLRLNDKEEFRRYLRMNTETYQESYLFVYSFVLTYFYRFKNY